MRGIFAFVAVCSVSTAFACPLGEVEVELVNYSSATIDELRLDSSSSANLLATSVAPGFMEIVCAPSGDHDIVALSSATGGELHFTAQTFTQGAQVVLADAD